MVLELVAARLIARYLGASLYTWTAVIGVVLGGITIGNYVGGRIADHYHARKALAVLFVICSFACVVTVVMNNLVGDWKLLWRFSLPMRVFAHVSLVFLLPSMLLGTISPVVAKMALDQGLATGRTVGSIYAWGAAGSIAGTFAAGYWLIAIMGSVAIVWIVAAVLLVMAICYWCRLWIPYVWLLLLASALTMGIGPWQWAQKAGAAVALRKPTKPDVIYEDESQYCYVAVNRIPGTSDLRDFVQDKLLHSRINMDNLLDLRYFYTRIYAAVTDRLSRDKDTLDVLVIGGGGYVFPRYVERVWPGSRIDVAEIDPGVTEAAIQAFGLDRNTSIRTIHMDARNYIDELLEHGQAAGQKTCYDFIYEDAINDYSVPFQLTTREFNEKIVQVLADDGIYMVNLIDVFDIGLFLGAVVNTLQETFGYVSVITEAGVPPSHRNTFVVIAARQQLDLDGLYEECRKKGTFLRHLSESDLRTLRAKRPDLVLTDDYAPVENLLAPVVRRKAAYDLAKEYFNQAQALFQQGKFDRSVEKYRQIIRRAPSMAIRAYNDMSLALIQQSKWADAADALSQALAAVSRDRMEIHTGSIHYNLGLVLRRMGKPQEAAQQFHKAIEDFEEQLIRKPKSSELHLKIGKSLASMGHLEQAEKHLHKALNLNPGDLYNHLELARNLEVQQRFDEAITLLAESVGFMLHHNRKDDASLLGNYLEGIKTRRAGRQ
jgi:tetratricopeptide (TPR) repeat protein